MSIDELANNRDLFLITVTKNSDDEQYSSDKTIDEVLEAYNDGKLLLCREPGGAG